MSLTRQVWLLLLGTILLALVGSVTVNLLTTRETLETQLRLKNNDNAALLALVLSQLKGDRDLMAMAMAGQFDTGFYRQIRLVGADGGVVFLRNAEGKPLQAPAWFVRSVPIESPPGMAQVSDGWRALGAVTVSSHTSFAYDDLWQATVEAAALLALVGVVAGTVGRLAVRRIRRPLDSTVEQAQALVEGRFITLPEPRAPELQRLTRAMNTMVHRLKGLFEAQAQQVDTLRRQAHCDPLTGLSNRTHFLRQLEASLDREQGRADGGLVLLRLVNLADVNRTLGHEVADRVIRAIAQALEAYPRRVGGCLLGRLNGSDFALVVPIARVADETAHALAEALRVTLPAFGSGVNVRIGVIAIQQGDTAAQLMSAADVALAGAESRVPFAVESMVRADQAVTPGGERTWRAKIHAALVEHRTQLVEFPVVDRAGRLLHLECPLRLQLEPGGAYEPAVRWLPLALRTRLTSAIDAHAVGLALQHIVRDHQARCVNLSPASLADVAFVAALRDLLQAEPHAARLLWLEVAESAALDSFRLLQAFGRQLRPLGVRLGLEHAGERLTQIDLLYEAGLDYVKLDSSVTRAVSEDANSASFVKNTVMLLHGLSLQVYAEGVVSEADLKTLWECGLDGVTGPHITERGLAGQAAS
jgi:diguanylate cyclase (GGDEF)-like protein